MTVKHDVSDTTPTLIPCRLRVNHAAKNSQDLAHGRRIEPAALVTLGSGSSGSNGGCGLRAQQPKSAIHDYPAGSAMFVCRSFQHPHAHQVGQVAATCAHRYIHM